MEHPSITLKNLAKENNISDITSKDLATLLDKQDELSKYRKQFAYPRMKTLPKVDLSIVNGEEDCVYLCGHSLGLCPKKTEDVMMEEIKKWKEMGVEGHMNGKYPWALIEEYIFKQMARLVGCKEIEVWIMNTLSVNLNVMMVPFYRPNRNRHKILIETGAFPSDHIAVEAQIRYHGYDPASSLLIAKPRAGEESIKMDDLIELIENEGDEIALILFAGVQYYTGQFFDLKRITDAGHKKGCIVGFDLAHAVGNVELKLHDWNVDFACWCTYKYMNSGPGATGGVYLHEKYANENYNLKRHAGWWGVDFENRFKMDNSDLPFVPGPAGFAHSNPPLFSTMGLFASLEQFDDVGIQKLVKKQRLLTGYLELLIDTHFNKPNEKQHVSYITPLSIEERGCMLSFAFSFPIEKVFAGLVKRGVVCDVRKPKVLRIAPAPFYNSFDDVHRFVQILLDVIEQNKNEN